MNKETTVVSVNIDDELEYMLDSYGLLGDDMEEEMYENGVSWADFI